MKIGIMTCWQSEDNYGQILQCYALQKYLREAGHDAYLIRYDRMNDYNKTPLWRKILKAFNPILLSKYFYYKIRESIYANEKKKHPRNFNDFRNEHIKQSERKYCSYKELAENPPEADVYIVGSDQIWNCFTGQSDGIMNRHRAVLLDFGNSEIKRVAYAASFGKTSINNAFIDLFSQLIKKFDYVSVREKSGLDICKQCGIDNAEWVPDPTMLLETEIYRGLYKDRQIKKPDKPYCFLYFTRADVNFPVHNIYKWAKKKDIDVVYVVAMNRTGKFKKTYATVPEWICLIENAEYVITDSFHCSLFSLYFNRKFGVVPITTDNGSYNTRVDSLFELFNLEKRYILNDFSVLDTDINWQSVSETLSKNRKTCKLLSVINI